MSEYPEALLEKVARAIDPYAWEPESPAYHRVFAREQAVAALDALGLREEKAEAWEEGALRSERFYRAAYDPSVSAREALSYMMPNPYREDS